MRIFSSFKDFYDFVVVDPDNRKVYNRETKEIVFSKEEVEKNPKKYSLSPIDREKLRRFENDQYYTLFFENGYVSVVAFCDRLRMFLVYKNVIYWHYEDIPAEIVKELTKMFKSRWEKWDDIKDAAYDKFHWYRSPVKDILRYKKIDWVRERRTQEFFKTKLNQVFNCPIIIINNAIWSGVVLNPKLSDIGFNKTITPTEAYQDIYNWIPYNEPTVPSAPEDMSRYEAKGFDKKTSFRPNMK